MVEKKPEHFPDRPLECSECKKPIAVRYTEITKDSIVNTSMCSDCPELHRRLHGTGSAQNEGVPREANAGLCCGNCGTALDEVKRGHSLGCMECYDVFGDLLLMEMQSSNRLPSRILPLKKSTPLYIGRSPGETLTISPSSRLLALNEALKDTLSREDYEQAAWLRDQIKALTDQQEHGQEGTEEEGNGRKK